MTAAAKIAEARALPDRICVWDCKTLDDGEVEPRGWSTSYPPRHPAEYVRADIADALAQENAKLRETLRLHQAWSDSENTGPDYGEQSRDTHPDGERIWRQWWDGNLDLCARAQAATAAALGDTP